MNGTGHAPTRQRLYTVRELAEMLQVPESWVYQRTAQGTIPHIRVGRYVRFKAPEVLDWLEGQHGRPTA